MFYRYHTPAITFTLPIKVSLHNSNKERFKEYLSTAKSHKTHKPLSITTQIDYINKLERFCEELHRLGVASEAFDIYRLGKDANVLLESLYDEMTNNADSMLYRLNYNAKKNKCYMSDFSEFNGSPSACLRFYIDFLQQIP